MATPLWGVVTPAGEPIVGSLHPTPHGAKYRFCACHNVEPKRRPAFWHVRETKGYRVRQFTLHHQEQTHG